ncbi:alanine--tRNA ligase [Chondrinema litorale]|uniref:alanine--tRNA ligase n=1 Tax=Chondrinema litorale TaxID=2994555 RepID=UPI0025448C7C|nr:alanine--tRNA ligase [Chondrinema litorale]UZR94427.1 alanine--tRNA ligase [Chondrinema litorale]
MQAQEIRRKFLEFFKEKQHEIVPSAPLVVKNDPTLMFTNAGMNQFKDFFLGTKTPIYRRAADTQKCLRVSGKHNDLEEVGIDTYHHTMFEMLGNWSFGDYFKEEAIKWAWELLTEVYHLPKDRLYVTVFEGDDNDGLAADSEAANIWKKYIEEDRIILASKKDNFWEMGETGPCGPCSEIHIDLRSEEDLAKKGGKDLVNQDDPLVVEIWNLVFIQFNRMASGKLEKLPAAHIDTGMGFERLAMAIQKKKSNYDTDVFQPLIQFIAGKAGVTYGNDQKTDIAIRVISDHVRAVSFAIADGQLPSNNKAGYVIRRILRRAVRYGYTFLGFKAPFINEMVAVLTEQFADVFPEIKEQEEFISNVILNEEATFLKTLENGLSILNDLIQKNTGDKVIKGENAFELYDTFGFPYDLTALIARENGFDVDEAGFKVELEKQKTRSRNAQVSEKGDWIIVNDGDSVEFVGYEFLASEAKILRYRELKEKKGTVYQLVLDNTPFYAESGGQVGDIGYIESDGEKVSIIDTKKENDLIVHFTKKLPSNPEATFKCVVNVNKRKLTENNHSATHLLHAALKRVLGEHVQQKGSLVNEKVLRFDFSHYAKMTDEEIAEVEKIVNQKIRENISLDEKRNVPIEAAKGMGATALFGEKYGDFVRVITFDKEYSIELCGGTHVPATGKIGFLKIVSESSVAAGVRRIEAVTADEAEALVNANEQVLKQLDEILKNPKDLNKAVSSLLDERNQMQKELEKFRQKEINQLKDTLVQKGEDISGITAIISKVSLPNADALRKLSFDLKNKVNSLFMVIAAEIEGKPQIAVMLSEDVIENKGLDAVKIIRELAREIKGGGGGQPFYATAGGKDVSGLDNVVAKAKDFLN